MYLELPKDLYRFADYTFPTQNPFGRISPVKGGVLIYNMSGALIGQAFREKTEVTISVADGGSLKVQKKGNDILFDKTCFTDAERVCPEDFIFFGSAKSFQYTLYRKQEKSVQPCKVACVVEHPYKDDLFCVQIFGKENILRTVLICLAVLLLND